MKLFKEHLFNFAEKLTTKEPFAFSRYSDGELYILKNIELKLDQNLIKIGDHTQWGPYKKEDFKHFDPITHKFFRDKLIEAFQFKKNNYYKGVSCKCCVGEENFKYQIDLHNGDDESLTWANLFVNSNYPNFIQTILPLFQSYDTIMICNEKANLSKLEFVTKDFRVGYNAMVNDYHKIEEIKKWIDSEKAEGRLFLFSASTFSNLAIHELFKHNDKNTYLDIGTCLTPFMDMPTDRSYLQEYWYKKQGNDLNKICTWN